MTSNMTMTAISICNFLKLIVKSTVEHYTEDFKLDIKIFKRYAKEAQETGKPVSMLWFCRSCGTYLCPEEDAYKKDTPMFITFKYYDEQEEEEARTIKAFLVTVTGMEGQKPVGYITPINYADECDRIRRYAVPAEKVELVYDKGSLGLCLLNPVFNMILAFGHYEYHGIPQDGYSYSQLKTKYEEKKAEQQNNPSTVQYQAPETPKEPSQNVQYQTPNAPAEVKTPPTQQNQNQDNG